jgi:2-methylcitrate dehydratase PrpD
MAMPDLHPSGVIVPVVLAVGEWQDTAGAELLTAIVLGFELCIRIGRAGYDADTRTSRFLQRGQDASAICGAVAGAAVAARLLGLDAGRIADAMGIAVSLASGSLEANRSGGTVKRFQSGWAAKSAIQAACLAKAGVDGPAQAFEGRYGFYRCFLDGAFDAAMLGEELGWRWEVCSLRFKPYPSNYYTHAGIEPRRAALMRRITIVADPRCDAVFPDQAPALLTVVTTAGEQLSEAVMVNRGAPGRPLDDSELAAKFIDCAKRALPADAAGSLRRAIEELPGGSAAAIARLARAA